MEIQRMLAQTNTNMPKSFYLICLFIVFSFSPHYANSEVLFEDNFNTLPDWESIQEESKSCGTGSDVYEFATTCTTHCPPPITSGGVWAGANYASSAFCDSPGEQLYKINNVDPRGGTGKSLVNNVEINNASWTGGRLVYKLPTPQTTLYMRMYVKYPNGFIFHDGITDHGYQKLMSLSSFPPHFPVDGQIFGRGSDFYNSPDIIWQNFSNRAYYSGDQYQINPNPRNAPGYGSADDAADAGYLRTIDGGWHQVEVGVGLNSAPGVDDGFFELYFDGVKTHSDYTFGWVKSIPWSTGVLYYSNKSTSAITPNPGSLKGFRPLATHTSGGSAPNWSLAVTIGDIVSDGVGNQWEYFTDWKWNIVWLLDNIYIGSAGVSEQQLYVDDLVVSTSRLPIGYQVGGAQSKRYRKFRLAKDN